MDARGSAKRAGAPAEIPRDAARRRRWDLPQYVEGILAGDRSTLAQAITLIESARPEGRALAEEVIERCLPFAGHSIRVGITGVPGAGKSTLIDALGKYLIEGRGEKVAVLAIDPSSQVTGGSILGDKTRMTYLASSERAFIRPSPSRGSFGGVAQYTREAMLLCEAAGYGNILVETVGIGQAETAVHGMVDFFMLLMLAGAGDDLQGIKRGVMELAHLVVINKADGGNEAAAEKARAQAANALHFFAGTPWGWMPRALACSALNGLGMAEIWDGILEYAALSRASGWFDRNRREQRRAWMQEALEHGLKQLFVADPVIRRRMETLDREVLEGLMTPFRAARALLEMYRNSGSGG